jgi:hypothetical protein
MKNLMISVKNALGMRAEASDVAAPGCGSRGSTWWRWVMYHSM